MADLLRWPVVGALLRWRHLRTAAQLVLLAVAAGIVLDGLTGPRLRPASVATTLTWVHYRGLLVVALLAAGNLFCAGCPLILARDAGRRLITPRFRWPRRLRTKWIGVALFVAVLFVYELFDLWALPRATAWLVLTYFAGALVIDVAFSGASFCKYICPVGQFSFAAATLSPLEVRVRTPERCLSCTTFDCIKGRPATPARSAQRGCELRLFQPLKTGNLDCTFCLDCVQACPHDNVMIATRVPGAELADPRRRSGIGTLTRRSDLAALAIVFTFGAWLNAFAMTAPAFTLQGWLARATGSESEAVVLALLFAAALVVAPLILLGGAAVMTTVVSRSERSRAETLIRYSFGLLPLGFAIWVAHYLFHLLTGALVILPGAQRAGMAPGSVLPIELGFIVLGAMGSLAVTLAISQRDHPSRPVVATFPWAVVVLALAGTTVWVLFQPMQMRAAGFAG